MAVKGFAITPKGILSGVRRIAPNVSIEILWEVDPDYIWEGDGPNPEGWGYKPHSVYVYAVVVTEDGDEVAGRDHLEGIYEKPGVEEGPASERRFRMHPMTSSFFVEMLSTSLYELSAKLFDKAIPSRKEWDPRIDYTKRVGEDKELAKEVVRAINFVERSSDEIDNREQRRA